MDRFSCSCGLVGRVRVIDLVAWQWPRLAGEEAAACMYIDRQTMQCGSAQPAVRVSRVCVTEHMHAFWPATIDPVRAWLK